MTLTEFLLARIAEDEDRAAEWTYTENVGAGRVRTVTVPVGITSARVLAECEAHRRIVERYAYLDREHEALKNLLGLHDLEISLALVSEMEAVVRILALPHVAHPDYDPAWRL